MLTSPLYFPPEGAQTARRPGAGRTHSHSAAAAVPRCACIRIPKSRKYRKKPGTAALSCCAAGLRPERLRPKHRPRCTYAGSRRKSMTVSEAVSDPVEESVESMELATRNGFHLEPRCRVCRNDHVRGKVNQILASGSPLRGHSPCTRGGQRRGSPSVIGSRSTQFETTAAGIFQSKTSPKRPTGRSSNAGLGRTASTSSRVWPRRSRPLRSSRRSWSEV